MRIERIPLLVGIVVGAVTLAGGLYLTADRTGVALPGRGDALPVPGAGGGGSVPAGTGEGSWRTPDVFAGVDVSSLTYAEYLALIQQMSDPRGPQPYEDSPETVRPNGLDFTGQEGWDSSAFPRESPVAPPDGSTLHIVRDNVADAPGRYWDYVAPYGSDPEELCAYGRDALRDYGSDVPELLSGDPCTQPVFGGRVVTSYLSERRHEGPMLNIYVREDAIPCPDAEATCHLFGVFLRESPIIAPPPPAPSE